MIITCWDATLMNSLWLLSLTASWCVRTSCQEGTAGYEIATSPYSKTNKPHIPASHPIVLTVAAQTKPPAMQHPCWIHLQNNCDAKPPGEGESKMTARAVLSMRPLCGIFPPEIPSPWLLSSAQLQHSLLPHLVVRCTTHRSVHPELTLTAEPPIGGDCHSICYWEWANYMRFHTASSQLRCSDKTLIAKMMFV